MDAREREYKMALAARLAYEEWSMTRRWDTSENAMVAGPMPWHTVSQAAVRAAYEIDGVRELVEAADRLNKIIEACQQILAKNLLPEAVTDEHTVHDLFGVLDDILTMDLQHQASASAARVREAMGGGS